MRETLRRPNDPRRIDPSIARHCEDCAISVDSNERKGSKIPFDSIGKFSSRELTLSAQRSIQPVASPIDVCFYLKCHFVVGGDNEPVRIRSFLSLSRSLSLRFTVCRVLFSETQRRQSNIRQSKCYLLRRSTQHRLSPFRFLSTLTPPPSFR